MAEDDLQWLADGAADLVPLQASNLAAITEGLASLIGQDQHSGALSSRDEVRILLWSISHQVGVLGALAGVASEAETLRGMSVKPKKSKAEGA